jgi:uncharacterized membrane protein YjfL (UPF0719 family)
MSFLAAVSLAEVGSTIFYSALGVLILCICWWLITKLSPFPIVKEIEKDQNVALAILIGSVFVSLAIIIASVIVS